MSQKRRRRRDEDYDDELRRPVLRRGPRRSGGKLHQDDWDADSDEPTDSELAKLEAEELARVLEDAGNGIGLPDGIELVPLEEVIRQEEGSDSDSENE